MKQLILISFLFCSQLTFSQTAAELYLKAKEATNKKNYKDAITMIDKAIVMDDTKPEYYQLKGDAYLELKEYQEAFNIYTKAIAIFPRESFLYNNRGNIYLGYKQFGEAIRDFSSALEYAANDSIKKYCLANRAAAKSNKRDFIGAYDDLQLAYTIDSLDVGTLINLGAICDEIGKGDETLKYLLKAVEIDPKAYPAYGNIGFKYQELGQHEKAIEYFNKVLEISPKEAFAFSNRSYNKLKLGDLKGAMKDIEKSIELMPGNAYAYRNRALIYIEQKKFDKACDDLQTAIDKQFLVMYGDEVLSLQKKYCKK